MRSFIWLCTAVLVVAALFGGCEKDPQTAAQGEAKIGGTVIDEATLAPLEGVGVTASSVTLGSKSTVTDAQGYYELTFTLDSMATVELAFAKSGYNDKSQTT